MTLGLIALLYLSAASAGFLAAGIVWRHRAKPGARPLACMLAASAFWALCDVFELGATSVESRRFISQMQYLGVVSAAPFFLHAAFGLAGRTTSLPRAAVFAIWVVPVITLLVAWTSTYHTWLWTAIRVPDDGVGPGIYEYGWWFWVLTADHYLLSALGLVVLVRASRQVRSGFRAPLELVALAIALPWLGNVVYVFKLGPWPGFNWLAVSIILSGLLFTWLVVRQGLFDLLPAAREAIVELMTDGVLVVDDDGQLLLANPAARRLLDIRETDAAPPALLAALAIRPRGDRSLGAVELRFGDTEARWLELRRGDVSDRWGVTAAHLIVIRDITRRRQVEEERETLIDSLTSARGRIETLEGLLPICAQCKKIRDDGGAWRPVEAYFESRSSVEFTHGICPDCTREFFKAVTPP